MMTADNMRNLKKEIIAYFLLTVGSALFAIGDVMFVNPLFYLNPNGQEIIRRLAPSTVVVYHLAEVKDGVVSPFQRAVQRDAEKNAPLAYRLVLLDKIGQTEEF